MTVGENAVHASLYTQIALFWRPPDCRIHAQQTKFKRDVFSYPSTGFFWSTWINIEHRREEI